jgi:plastocyanin
MGKNLSGHTIRFNLLILSMILLLSACGGSSPSSSSTTSTTTTAQSPIASFTSTPTGQTPTATATPTPKPTPTPTPRPTLTPTPRPVPTPTPRPKPTPVPQQTVVVQIVGTDTFSFSPASISITPGTVVEWINHTQAPHTVTGSSFGSATINPGGIYTFTFHAAGRFAYHCNFHPYMIGTVNVT